MELQVSGTQRNLLGLKNLPPNRPFVRSSFKLFVASLSVSMSACLSHLFENKRLESLKDLIVQDAWHNAAYLKSPTAER